ncbi:MAG: DUF4249 domain-containing protein [Brumimicrobium sp.]
MKKNYILFILIVFISTTACRKIIDLEVTDTEPKLVIEGVYDATNERVDVKITKTINVFSSDTFPIITGANVTIYDENNNASTLNDNGDGTYSLENYLPIFNSIYRMKVEIGSSVYEAEDYLIEVNQIDSLTYEYKSGSFLIGEDGYAVYMYGSDPPGIRNFYRLIKIINHEYQTDISDQLLFDDEFGDGSTIKLTLFGSTFQLHDTVRIEVRSLSEQTFKYQSSMLATAGNSGFSAAPANPISNWNGPEECLGNFSVYGFSTDSIVVGN